MNTNFFIRSVLFCLTMVLFTSCDKDFNEIGSDIVGDDHFNLDRDVSATVLAYNQKLGAVQSNNLPINALGFYNHPVFGRTTANFLTQVELIASSPTFQPNPVIINVEMDVPYFSTLTATSELGVGDYKLDSIYGDSKFKLDVFESTYYLRDFDPALNFQEGQKYFSDFNIGGNYNPLRLNNGEVGENDNFFFSRGEKITITFDENGEQVTTRETPRMRLRLRNDFFQDKIFGPDATGQLVNNNTFKNYFRGLYFKVTSPETASGSGSLNQINFREGKIKITYEVDDIDSDGNPILLDNGTRKREEKSLSLTLTGNTVNIIENIDAQPYLANTTTNVNTTTGDPRLYLKGQQGSMAVIDLFGKQDSYQYKRDENNPNGPWLLENTPNNVPDELDEMRNKEWLVNEANLTFYIDTETLGATAFEPRRIYLYDLNNNRPLLDYYSDTSVDQNPKENKKLHDGIIKKQPVANGRGIRYQVRLTNHMRNLLKRNPDATKDSTNVRLGLVVTENIGTVTSARLKTPLTVNYPGVPATLQQGFSIDRTPNANVINPLGTVLFGSDASVPENKKLKLEIYYTKPN